MSSGQGGPLKGWRAIAKELRPTLALAGPVVAAELGWIGMGVVDTMIVGGLGAEAVGAVGLGSVAFYTVAVFGMGLLLGLDTLVSQAFGAGDLDDCHHSLFQGIYLAAALTPLMMLLVILGAPYLPAAGLDPEALRGTPPYLRATAWGTFPLLVYAALRRYLQAIGRVWPVMYALLTANLINAAGNWLLVFGHLGFPALGVEGSGWATTISRLYLAVVMITYTVWHDRKFSTGLANVSWRPDAARLRRLLGLGLPAACHVTLEVGVFATATGLAAGLGAVALAAHQVVLNVSSVTFMIPFALGSAGAVRVGQAIGRRETRAASRAGWMTLVLAISFMTAAAVVFVAAPSMIVRSFTTDPAVVAAGISLLYTAAAFQIFDGIQGVTTGNLRGAGDTKTAMAAGLIAHWCVGLPIGYVLAFPARLGVVGLWVGLSIGLIAAAAFLFRAWLITARGLRESAEDALASAGFRGSEQLADR